MSSEPGDLVPVDTDFELDSDPIRETDQWQ
jgi:hypothetical protein